MIEIKTIKKELGIIDADIAEFFGYKNKISYSNSARKRHIENGIVEIYNRIQERWQNKNSEEPEKP
jgi:isopentenyldiphosphate isomerase